jgi:hypothetical protein
MVLLAVWCGLVVGWFAANSARWRDWLIGELRDALPFALECLSTNPTGRRRWLIPLCCWMFLGAALGSVLGDVAEPWFFDTQRATRSEFAGDPRSKSPGLQTDTEITTVKDRLTETTWFESRRVSTQRLFYPDGLVHSTGPVPAAAREFCSWWTRVGTTGLGIVIGVLGGAVFWRCRGAGQSGADPRRNLFLQESTEAGSLAIPPVAEADRIQRAAFLGATKKPD